LKVKDELIGKEVLDAKGHELGKVDDVDVDFDSDKIDSIILHEGGRLRGRDRVIPYSMIETVGERILLKKSGEKSKGMM
jgi:sporulation protein YlmC with PRC-barrel domain